MVVVWVLLSVEVAVVVVAVEVEVDWIGVVVFESTFSNIRAFTSVYKIPVESSGRFSRASSPVYSLSSSLSNSLFFSSSSEQRYLVKECAEIRQLFV